MNAPVIAEPGRSHAPLARVFYRTAVMYFAQEVIPMLLKPDRRTDLDHRAFMLRGNPPGAAVVAADNEGRLSVLDSALRVSFTRDLRDKIGAISPYPSDHRLALVVGAAGSLAVQHYDGSQIAYVGSPQLEEATPPWVKQGFTDCHFDVSGDFLWLVMPRNSHTCEIWLVESKSWSLVDKLIVPDSFGGSSCSFHQTASPDLLSLWMAAGQDGQHVYWLRREQGKISCTFVPQLTNSIPPVFSPCGEYVLVVNENHGLCKYDFASMRQIGLPLEFPDEDNPFSWSLCFLDGRRVLVSTNEDRVFSVDAVRMEIEEEVIVKGHEPRPIGEYYPTLAHEEGVATDISYFKRLGHIIVFVCRLNRESGSAAWKDSLLWLSADLPAAAP